MHKCMYTGRDSYQRLELLQALCYNERNSYDALLFVGGADGLFSNGSQGALKYLFLGKTGQELLGEQVIPQQYEFLEEIVLLVTPKSLSIFYPLDSDSATFLIPFLSSWRNVTEYVVSDEMNQDLRELTKIQAFKEMIEPYSSIGIPLNSPRDAKMAAEKWPLIQSFGLDEVSGKGFFTMHHNVVDVSSLLAQTFKKMDDYCARRLVTEAQPALLHHYNQFIEKLDHAESPTDRASKSEVDIGDDLISFYDFGTIRHEARGQVKSSERGSRVLFGTRTMTPSTQSSKSVTPSQAGIKGFAASHFTVVAEEPFTGLRVARSYFLGTGKCIDRIVDMDSLVHPTLEKLDRYDSLPNNAPDTRYLIDLYEGLLEVHSNIMKVLVERVQSKVDSTLQASVDVVENHARNLLEDKFPSAGRLKIVAESMNACGEKVDSGASSKWCQIYLTCTIDLISSRVIPSEVLGSLLVGDTVVFNNDHASYLVVTAEPAFENLRTWIQAGQEADHLSHVQDVLSSDYMIDQVVGIGQVIGERTNHGHVLIQSDSIKMLRGQLTTYTNGFVLMSPQCQPFIVSFRKDVQSLRVLSTPHEELLLIVIELKPGPKNPLAQVFPSNSVGLSISLPLVAGTRMQENLLVILDAWKQSAIENDLPFIKPQLDESETIPKGFKLACEYLLDIDSNATIKSNLFPQWFISRTPSQLSTWSRPKFNYVVPVTLFLGLPGSQVKTISMALSEMTSGMNEWHHIVVDTREVPHGSETSQIIGSKLSALAETIQKESKWTLRPRILLTVIGHVDPITVCSAVKNVDESLLKLSTVTTVISAHGVFQPKTSNPYPKLWDQLTPGFVSSIVLLHVQDIPKNELHRLRMRVDAANSFAEVICLRSNGLDGDLSSFLALDQFESTDRQLYRDAHFPNWQKTPSKYTIPAKESITAVRFEMQLRLDRNQFLACIQQALCPQTELKAIVPVHPLQSVSTELKGLRLAQALAIDKVSQNLFQKEDISTPPTATSVAAESGVVWTIEATLSFADDHFQEYSYVNTGTRAFLRASKDIGSIPMCTISFTGVNLNAEKLRELLLLCCPSRHHSVSTERQSKHITMDEKRKIQSMHATDSLPDGYIYDGTSYYDYFGGQYQFHPNINEFIDEYLNKKNEIVRRQNNEVEQDRLRYEECTKQM